MDIFPPRIKYGPGMAFDLATHTVKDGELFQLLREKDEEKRRGAYRAVEKRELEEKYKGSRDAEAFMKDGRRYMRIEPKRFTETQERGYDVVTNEPLQGRDCKVTFPHRLPNRSHFWSTLGPTKEEHDARQRARVDRAYADDRGNSAPVSATGGMPGSGAEPEPEMPPTPASARSAASSRRSMASARSGASMGGRSVASSRRSMDSARSGASTGRRGSNMSASQPLKRPDNVPPVPLYAMGGPGGAAGEPPKTHSSWRSGSSMSMSRRSGRSSVRSVRSSGFGDMQGY